MPCRSLLRSVEFHSAEKSASSTTKWALLKITVTVHHIRLSRSTNSESTVMQASKSCGIHLIVIVIVILHIKQAIKEHFATYRSPIIPLKGAV
jgi:hypothetical protein